MTAAVQALDLTTLRIVFALITLLLFALVVTVRHARPYSAYSRWWALAMLAYFLSGSAYLAEDTAYEVWALPGGRLLLVAGTQCLWAGVRTLTRPVRGWWMVPLPALVMLTTALGDPVEDRWAGAAIFFGVMALVTGGTAVALWTLPTGYRRLQLPMACAMTVVSFFYLVRLAIFLTRGADGMLFGMFLGASPSTVVAILLVVTSTFSTTVLSAELFAHDLRVRANHDGLTGLLNRQGFLEVAQADLDRSNRRGLGSVLVIMDLDHFKRINDAHGHSGGDEVLAAFARVAEGRIRRTDLLARYGGEEFILLLTGVTPHQAQQITRAIADMCAATTTDSGIGLPTISFGLACSDHFDGELQAVIAAADQALYRAKRNGRNQSAIA